MGLAVATLYSLVPPMLTNIDVAPRYHVHYPVEDADACEMAP
jgi:hypothetical protein